MSKLLWFIIVIVVAVGGWYYWDQSQMPASLEPTQSSESSQSAQKTLQMQTGESASLTSGSSDAELNADLNALDAQLQGASADTSSAGSFNDTPVPQAE